MELVLPNNYVEIEEEQQYLEGGDYHTFSKNIKGVFASFSSVSRGLRAGGWGWGKIVSALSTAARYGYWWAVANFGWPVVKIGLIVGGIIGGLIATASATLAICYLYNNRVFY